MNNGDSFKSQILKGLYLRSQKENRCHVLPSSLKRTIRKFHFVVVQLRQRNVQKSIDARAKVLFCQSKLTFF